MTKEQIIYKMKRAYRLGQSHALDAAMFKVNLKRDSEVDLFMSAILNEKKNARREEGEIKP